MSTTTAGLDLQAIHPSRGAKFSPNLHRWLSARDQTRVRDMLQAFRHDDGTLFLGYTHDGDFIGTRLARVLVAGVKAERGCYGHAGRFHLVADFWANYQRDGRCAIDLKHTMHFVGDDTRWSVDGDTRHCLWCGNATQTLRRWSETVQREAWEPAAMAGTGGASHG